MRGYCVCINNYMWDNTSRELLSSCRLGVNGDERMLVPLANNDLETLEQLCICWIRRRFKLFLDELLDVLGEPGQEASLGV